MYFRGILNFALHHFYDAITDFETVIEKSEDTNAKYYLARGRCYACLSMFKEAITDLSIAINLNKELLDVKNQACLIIIGLPQQREMRVPNRRHRLGLYGLPKTDSSRTCKSCIHQITVLEKSCGTYLRRKSLNDNRFV